MARSVLLLAVLALLSLCAAPLVAASDDSVQWVQPAFIEAEAAPVTGLPAGQSNTNAQGAGEQPAEGTSMHGPLLPDDHAPRARPSHRGSISVSASSMLMYAWTCCV